MFVGGVVALGKDVNVDVGTGGILVGLGGIAVVGIGVGEGVFDGTGVFDGIFVTVLVGAGLVLVGGTGVDEGGTRVGVGGTGVLVGAGTVEVKVNTRVGGMNAVGGGTYGTHNLCPGWIIIDDKQLRAINTWYEMPCATPILKSVSPGRTI